MLMTVPDTDRDLIGGFGGSPKSRCRSLLNGIGRGGAFCVVPFKPFRAMQLRAFKNAIICSSTARREIMEITRIMKRKCILCAIGAAIPWALVFSQIRSPRTDLFDDGWRFHRGGALGAEMEQFDDSAWREVDLPHDWSIEDIPGTSSPFDSNAVNQVSGGFTVGGTGWYRKSFALSEADSAQRFTLYFEGSYMLTTVWVNGQAVGKHFYGYTSFGMDITSHLHFGKDNTVAVKVINEGENSRWYSGSGLYRHVWLMKTHPIHVPLWGIAVTTPQATPDHARVSVKTLVKNGSPKDENLTLKTILLDSEGREAGAVETNRFSSAKATVEFNQTIQVPSPRLWCVEKPHLYSLITEIIQNQARLDRVVTPVGIRSLSFSSNLGFLLNGKPVKLKGGCVHHDNGPLGARAFDRAEERRVELLKSSGFNAIRCAHNPPSPAFLDACDRLGMLVVDEAFDMWTDEKNPYDYHLFFGSHWREDLEGMILRDRNHPSVVVWSIGNEIMDVDKPGTVAIGRELASTIRRLDPSRPVTLAVNQIGENKDPVFDAVDIAGYNYGLRSYVPDHRRKPGRVIVSTESYPLESFEYWMGAVDHPWVIGDFVWTAFDYIGEASIGWRGYIQKADFFPWNLAYCGDIDVCGWKRPQSFYRDALWKPDQISLFVKPPVPTFEFNPEKEYWSIWNWSDVVADWNWEGCENAPLGVEVYSSCDEVELTLNGQSLGRKPTNRSTKYMAEWKVPYQPGTLKAVGTKSGKPRRSAEIQTAGPPAQIRLSADRTVLKPDHQDLGYVTLEVLDNQGRRCPKAENTVRFEVTGPATIAAVGNGDPTSLESYQRPHRKTWQGRCLVVLRAGSSTGTAVLTVSSEGIPPATIRIEVR
jgi:beta-galactosidase